MEHLTLGADSSPQNPLPDAIPVQRECHGFDTLFIRLEFVEQIGLGFACDGYIWIGGGLFVPHSEILGLRVSQESRSRSGIGGPSQLLDVFGARLTYVMGCPAENQRRTLCRWHVVAEALKIRCLMWCGRIGGQIRHSFVSMLSNGMGWSSQM